MIGKLTRLIFVCMFIISSAYGTIQVKDMRQVFSLLKKADINTLVIFDVDMVLIQPSEPAFQMPNMKRYNSVFKKILQEVPENKHPILLSLATIKSESIYVDPLTPQLICQLVERKVPIMALTANLTGELQHIPHMELWRVEGLRHLGIDFSSNAPSSKKIVFDTLPRYRGNYSIYTDGILFVNGAVCTKGEALIAFLENINFYPERILFVDDREENLTNVETALQKFNIEYQGIHYVGAKDYPSEFISENDFEIRWSELADQVKKIN